MNLSKVDLNLFVVFDAIYSEANLTRAGQIVGITQPAVSNALARLRDTFNDPLFVRTAQGMVPTPLAQNIITPIRSALQQLRLSVQESHCFKPAEANKSYRMSMNDFSEGIILPTLFQRLGLRAPKVRVESMLARRRDTTTELAAGRLDFAVDAPLNIDPQVRHVRLLADRYVCAMRAGHPLSSESLTLERYLSQPHIHISSRRSGLGYVDLALGKMGIQRRIALRSQHYLMACKVLRDTDMLITVPERFACDNGLHFVELPISDLPPLETHLYWHESTDQDPANRWMREQIIDICKQLETATHPREASSALQEAALT